MQICETCSYAYLLICILHIFNAQCARCILAKRNTHSACYEYASFLLSRMGYPRVKKPSCPQPGPRWHGPPSASRKAPGAEGKAPRVGLAIQLKALWKPTSMPLWSLQVTSARHERRIDDSLPEVSLSTMVVNLPFYVLIAGSKTVPRLSGRDCTHSVIIPCCPVSLPCFPHLPTYLPPPMPDLPSTFLGRLFGRNRSSLTVALPPHPSSNDTSSGSASPTLQTSPVDRDSARSLDIDNAPIGCAPPPPAPHSKTLLSNYGF